MGHIIFVGYKDMEIFKVLYAKKQADVIRNLFWCFIYIFLPYFLVCMVCSSWHNIQLIYMVFLSLRFPCLHTYFLVDGLSMFLC